uniref:Ig-like domain-containing protein n=1 Tax=Timema shepardi TaxID=629360 RepID=A0A7R9AL90_TIMSH|nr:unnamed protein product [Timema shepardi]
MVSALVRYVERQRDKQVSWIRRRDSHILTVDRYTFIADERFQAFLVEATDTWTLQIKYVQARDAGQYECQVSTEPKMSHFITLNVVGTKSITTNDDTNTVDVMLLSCKHVGWASLRDSSREGRDWSNAMSITRIRDRPSYDKKARNTKHRLHKEYSSRRTTACSDCEGSLRTSLHSWELIEPTNSTMVDYCNTAVPLPGAINMSVVVDHRWKHGVVGDKGGGEVIVLRSASKIQPWSSTTSSHTVG